MRFIELLSESTGPSPTLAIQDLVDVFCEHISACADRPLTDLFVRLARTFMRQRLLRPLLRAGSGAELATSFGYTQMGMGSFAHERTQEILLEDRNRLEVDPFLKRKPKRTRGATPCLPSSGSFRSASSPALSRDFSCLGQITRTVSSSRPRSVSSVLRRHMDRSEHRLVPIGSGRGICRCDGRRNYRSGHLAPASSAVRRQRSRPIALRLAATAT